MDRCRARDRPRGRSGLLRRASSSLKAVPDINVKLAGLPDFIPELPDRYPALDAPSFRKKVERALG